MAQNPARKRSYGAVRWWYYAELIAGNLKRAVIAPGESWLAV
jgi:hypothetical protein